MPAENDTRLLAAELERSTAEAIARLPRKLGPYARQVAAATLAGERSHGQRLPEPPHSLSTAEASRVQLAVDAACDRVRLSHLQVGIGVRVRCYGDEVVRRGRIEAIQPGASAPVTIRVEYPDGHRDSDGAEPINPSNYSLDQVVEPRSPHEPDAAQLPAAPDPVRHVEHELGQAGKGWRLPDGGIVTWRTGPRGGPSHEAVYRALGLPEEWLPEFDHDAERFERSQCVALAFRITPAGGFTDECGERLTRQKRDAISALILLAYAEARYIEDGWVHSGAIGIETAERRAARLNEPGFRAGLGGLRAEGRLRRRPCEEERYELPPDARVRLIEAHGLEAAWTQRALGNPSDHRFGEIARARLREREESQGRRAFSLRVPGAFGAVETVAVELALEHSGGRMLRLKAAWGPSFRSGGAQPPHVPEGSCEVETRTSVRAGLRIRGALLAEAERQVHIYPGRGIAIAAMCAWLAGLEPGWLTQAPPPPTD